MRKARESEASVLGSSSTISMRAFMVGAFHTEYTEGSQRFTDRFFCAPLGDLSGPSVKRLCCQRELNSKCAACSGAAFYRNLAAVIADHRLDDGEAPPGSVLLGRVVGREQALALFRGHACAGILYFNASVVRISARAQRQCAALWHGINRIQ